MTPDELDQLFGPAIPPQRPTTGWEEGNTPLSLTRLTAESAAPLGQLLQSISSGWRLGQIWLNDTIIIWIVSREGGIFFAIEELVLSGLPVGVPKHQRMALTSDGDKLGHPSLVRCENARIGGEIYFDQTIESWVINNRSGRYGAHPSRNRQQLERVANRFSEHGINLSVEFV